MKILKLKHKNSNRKVKIISQDKYQEYFKIIKSLELDDTAIVFLTKKNKPLIVDAEFKDTVEQFAWSHSNTDSVRTRLNNQNRKLIPENMINISYLYLSHFIYFIGHNKKAKQEIDHINRIPWDNRLSNLREVSREVNLLNRKGWSKKGDNKRCPIKYTPSIGKWCARDGNEYIGVYDTVLEAAKALVEHLEQDSNADICQIHLAELCGCIEKF